LTGQHTQTPAVTPRDGQSQLPPTGSLTATRGPTAVAATSTNKPNIRLIYNDFEFLLINISAARVDASRLIFEQTLPTGELRSFQATAWNREGVIDAPARMRAGGCYQLLTAVATQKAPGRDVCAQLLGFVQSAITRFYFWTSDQPGATFTVRMANSQTALATCQIDAGECEFYVGPGEEAPVVAVNPSNTPTLVPTSTPTPVLTSTSTPILTSTPTPVLTSTPAPTRTATAEAAPVGEYNLRLIYDKEQFLLINISDAPLDVSQLVFEQELTDSSVRTFEAKEWERTGIVVPPTAMTAQGCYQLVTAEGTQAIPADDICPHFLGWYSTGVESRYFWIANNRGASFVVRRTSDTAPLATCSVDAGECEVHLPAQ
jgi:hypothetical protein